MTRTQAITPALLALFVLTGCMAEPKSDPKASKPQAPKESSGTMSNADKKSPVESMHKAIADLKAKPEHQDDQVKVQHILISFQGAPRMSGVTRSKEEAEKLSADVFQEIQGGADFDQLVKKHTNDSHPGIYPMTKGSRSQMVKGFGDVAWRLKVGEVGIAPHDASASPFGWHIIKRLN